MGLWKTPKKLRESLGASLGRGMDKVFGDQPDSAARPVGQRSSVDPLWTMDAASFPSELRGSNPPDQEPRG